MKTFIKIFACAVVASSFFGACGDTNTVNNGCKAKAAAKSIAQTWGDLDCEVYDEAGLCKKIKGEEDLPIHDISNYLRIEPLLKEWIEEQLAVGSNDRTQVSVSDVISPPSQEYEIRVSPPIGEIIEKGYSGWLALMTAEEIVELTEKYKGLIIDFYWGVEDAGNEIVGGSIGSSLPCD
jgi:hypothetical protein